MLIALSETLSFPVAQFKGTIFELQVIKNIEASKSVLDGETVDDDLMGNNILDTADVTFHTNHKTIASDHSCPTLSR